MQADEDLLLVEEKNMDQPQDMEEGQGTKAPKKKKKPAIYSPRKLCKQFFVTLASRVWNKMHCWQVKFGLWLLNC